jgi:cytidine deaminase
MTKLIQTAIQMRDKARAPYSNYKVGAALETVNGKIIGGCNIENSSFL